MSLLLAYVDSSAVNQRSPTCRKHHIKLCPIQTCALPWTRGLLRGESIFLFSHTGCRV